MKAEKAPMQRFDSQQTNANCNAIESKSPALHFITFPPGGPSTPGPSFLAERHVLTFRTRRCFHELFQSDDLKICSHQALGSSNLSRIFDDYLIIYKRIDINDDSWRKKSHMYQFINIEDGKTLLSRNPSNIFDVKVRK